jgi:hypothetical protein
MAVAGTLNCELQRVQIPMAGTVRTHLTTLRLRFAMVNPLRDVQEVFFLANGYFRAAALARAIEVIL